MNLATGIREYFQRESAFKRWAHSTVSRFCKQRDELTVKIELALDEGSLHTGLPPAHPTNVKAVAYAIVKELERKTNESAEDETPYPSAFGGHEW